MSRSPELYLTDILDAGQAMQGYLEGVSFAQFRNDRMRQSAVIREFEIIGEAVPKHVPATNEPVSSEIYTSSSRSCRCLSKTVRISTVSPVTR